MVHVGKLPVKHSLEVKLYYDEIIVIPKMLNYFLRSLIKENVSHYFPGDMAEGV